MSAVALIKQIDFYRIGQFAKYRRWVSEFVIVLAVKDKISYSQL